MKKSLLHKTNRNQQYLISIAMVCSVAALGYFLQGFMGYRVVAFMLLVTVSILAMFFDIVPVLLAAVLSALIWDFFFIPPHFTFTVGTTDDMMLLLMYFIIALIHSVLTFKIREMQEVASYLKHFGQVMRRHLGWIRGDVVIEQIPLVYHLAEKIELTRKIV